MGASIPRIVPVSKRDRTRGDQEKSPHENAHPVNGVASFSAAIALADTQASERDKAMLAFVASGSPLAPQGRP